MNDTQSGTLKKVLLAASASVVALGLGEILTRAFVLAPPVKPLRFFSEESPDSVYRRSANPILAFELKPNYRNDHPNQRSTYASTNSHGQRDVERQIQKPKGVRRVVLLGDSVVEGHGIPDIDDTMSRQLESLFENGTTEVLNFGVSGYSTQAEVELLETKALKFQPDVVILVFVGGNDFNNFTLQAYQLEAIDDRPDLINYLFVASDLFRLACIQLNLFHFGVEADPVRWNKHTIIENHVVEGIKRLRELAIQHGFKPIIAIWPLFEDAGIVDDHPMPNNSDELVIEHIGKSYGIPTVRLSIWFRQQLKGLSGKVNLREHYCIDSSDNVHPSKVGCRVAAELFKTILADIDKGQYAMEEDPSAMATLDLAARAAMEFGDRQMAYARAYLNIGLRREHSGDLDEAARYYQMAYDTKPDYAIALNHIGIVLAKQGKVSQAVEYFKSALAKDPNNAFFHSNIGRLLVGQDKFVEAESYFRQALRSNPNLAVVHVHLGDVLMRQRKLNQAASAYEAAVQLQPDFDEARQALGRVRSILNGISSD